MLLILRERIPLVGVEIEYLIEAHLDGDVVHTDCLGRRAAELMALATLTLLGRNGGGALVHVALDVLIVGLEIVQNLILNRPLEKVELPHGRIDA